MAFTANCRRIVTLYITQHTEAGKVNRLHRMRIYKDIHERGFPPTHNTHRLLLETVAYITDKVVQKISILFNLYMQSAV